MDKLGPLYGHSMTVNELDLAAAVVRSDDTSISNG